MKELGEKNAIEYSRLSASVLVAPENAEGLSGELIGRQCSLRNARHDQTIASLRLVWESRRLLGRVAGVGLLLSILVVLVIPARYQSVARLMPPDDQSDSGLAMVAALRGGGANMGGAMSDLLGLKTWSQLLEGVLHSRTVEDKIVQKFELRRVYGVRTAEIARKILASQTETLVDRKSQIMTIAITDTSPQRAAAMAQAYVEELNRALADVSTSSARRERIFLEGRLQEVHQDLEAAEEEFSQFASKNTAIDITEQGRAMVGAAATLQGQYIAARSELEGLRQVYSDNYVRVRSVEARITELDRQLRMISGKDKSPSTDKAAQDDSLYPSIGKLSLLGVTYADLYRQTKVQEALYETLTQEFELAKLQEAKETPTVKVLDPPDVPERKSFPPRRLLVLLGEALALSVGLAWVFGRTTWEQADPADPGVLLAQEVIQALRTSIPWTSRTRRPR